MTQGIGTILTAALHGIGTKTPELEKGQYIKSARSRRSTKKIKSGIRIKIIKINILYNVIKN